MTAVVLLFFFTTWRGWIPWDAGVLAQAADRVLHGERPHVDFVDPYPGLLTWVHAAAFAIGGESLATLRWVLLPTAIMAELAVYWMLRRMLSAPIAAGLLLGMAPWSIPMYPESMASWYAVFLSLFALATAEKARFAGGTAIGWWLLTGSCLAVAALVKTTGLATVLAIGMMLVWRNQSWARELAAPQSSWPMRMIVFCGLGLAAVAATKMASRLPGSVTLLYFCSPLWSLLVAQMVREFREARGGVAERLPQLAREALPVAGGFVVVIAGYLACAHPDAASLTAFYDGVFVLPFRRLQQDQVLGFDPAWHMMPAILAGASLVVALACDVPKRLAVPCGLFLAVIPWLLLGGDYADGLTRETAYWIMRLALPVAAIGGAWIAALPPDGDDSDRERAWLYVAAGSVCMFMQFPFPAMHYAAYILPCWGLAAAALIRLTRPNAPWLAGIVVSWFLACGSVSLLWIVPKADPYGTLTGLPLRPLAAWTHPRVNLTVPQAHIRFFDRLLDLIARIAPPGSKLLVYPDSPEINFLSDTRNPTPAFYHGLLPGFNLFDPRYMQDPAIPAVVTIPYSSSNCKPDAAVLERLRVDFPFVLEAGLGFRIYCREPPSCFHENPVSGPRALP